MIKQYSTTLIRSSAHMVEEGKVTPLLTELAASFPDKQFAVQFLGAYKKGNYYTVLDITECTPVYVTELGW